MRQASALVVPPLQRQVLVVISARRQDNVDEAVHLLQQEEAIKPLAYLWTSLILQAQKPSLQT